MRETADAGSDILPGLAVDSQDSKLRLGRYHPVCRSNASLQEYLRHETNQVPRIMTTVDMFAMTSVGPSPVPEVRGQDL